jgi:PKD repeat protein
MATVSRILRPTCLPVQLSLLQSERLPRPPTSAQVGTYKATFGVSDSSLKDAEVVKITATHDTTSQIPVPPTAQFTAITTQGNAPLIVQFDNKSVTSGTTSYK